MHGTLLSTTATLLRYYVYVIRDPRSGKRKAPIYVGKGEGDRAWEHWKKFGDKHPNEILARIFAKCKKLGLIPPVEVVARFETSAAAFVHEIALIAKYGRLCNGTGTLCNMTPGGDGFDEANYDPSFLEAVRKGYARVKDAVAKKNSARMKKNNRDKRFLAKVRHGQKINGQAKNAAATRRAKAALDPHFYDNLADGVSRTWKNSKVRAKRVAGIKATSRTPLGRARRRAAWTPERRAMQGEVAARTNRDPAARKIRAIGAKRSWEKNHAQRVAIIRAVHATPESRARKKASWTPERRAAQAERMRNRRKQEQRSA
jgi:hypothetical protein